MELRSDFLGYAFGLSRRKKRLVLCLLDSALLGASFLLAMALRLDGFSLALVGESWVAFAIILPPTIAFFAWLGLYRAVVRHVAASTLRVLALGLAISAASLFVVGQRLDLFLPRSVPIIYWLLAMFLLGGGRFGLRGLYRQSRSRLSSPVLIYGAGSAGRQLLASLQASGDYAPVAFIDDARELHGREIGGCRIYSPNRIGELIAQHDIGSMLLAIPSATRQQRKAIVERLDPFGVRVLTIPGMADIVVGRATISETREVAIEDLLGRDPIPPRQDLLDANIRGKTAMVTGAGGSIGSELCRQIARQRVARLVLLENSEFALYSVERELAMLAARERLELPLVPLLGSVQDGERVSAALRSHGVQTVFHAAAYKHVPLVEQNVVDGVRNNVFGTETVARSAIEAGVGAFVLVSTDKAVRPTSVMGASKRVAELVCQALARQQSATTFSIVRFGNVLGSSGSVIPLFRQQIEAGGPITVTHHEMTRYFMTIREAAQLVIQAGALARGGDVFVLDMGEPVRIIDLAMRMARLSGLNPVIRQPGHGDGAGAGGDIEIVMSQLRPGEKLYEELLIGGDAVPTVHPRILTASESSLDWPELASILQNLKEACDVHAPERVRAILRGAQVGFSPAAEGVEPAGGGAELPLMRDEGREHAAPAHLVRDGSF
ncbi:polysaccharide biosynthesis protein CapD [Ancylobacter novellus DSM 506]|uniref:Polysaccharide biosynthesis protein CapD n=2 Tax=Ancylobacter novellus TaxID=921 RepID=D7A834_ANCN5|nr:polysaccharide biosynthesis protein CapD [Ancylobacter novellus DSM 506]